MHRTIAVLIAAFVVFAVPAAAAAGQQTSQATEDEVSDLAQFEKTVAQNQFEYCGDVQPVFKNPDLQVQPDGFVHASGWFFIQFQVIQTEGIEVDRLAFSFGKPIPDSLRTCDTPEWITDAYYKDYRVDDDPSDGFFIPINTSNVPDGEWAAAISVYSGGEEVGRGFTRAIVENGCPNGYRDPTTNCPAQIRENDKVRPWPIVLPGDGEQIHGFNGLSIEFAEAIKEGSVKAIVDGEEVPLSPMEPRMWDEDSVAAAADEDSPVGCAAPDPICREAAWGPAFKWQGDIPEDAVVKVIAEDLSGNTVSKILHLTSTTVGGVVSVQLPDLDVKIPETDKTGSVGQTVEFEITFQNVGRDVAHTDLHAQASDDVQVTWEPNHIVVESGGEETAILKAKSNKQGTYEIDAWASYKRGNDDVRETIPLTLKVGEGSQEVRKANQTDEPLDTTQTNDTEDENGSPGPGSLVVLALVGAAAAALRRRS